MMSVDARGYKNHGVVHPGDIKIGNYHHAPSRLIVYSEKRSHTIILDYIITKENVGATEEALVQKLGEMASSNPFISEDEIKVIIDKIYNKSDSE